MSEAGRGDLAVIGPLVKQFYMVTEVGPVVRTSHDVCALRWT